MKFYKSYKNIWISAAGVLTGSSTLQEFIDFRRWHKSPQAISFSLDERWYAHVLCEAARRSFSSHMKISHWRSSLWQKRLPLDFATSRCQALYHWRATSTSWDRASQPQKSSLGQIFESPLQLRPSNTWLDLRRRRTDRLQYTAWVYRLSSLT